MANANKHGHCKKLRFHLMKSSLLNSVQPPPPAPFSFDVSPSTLKLREVQTLHKVYEDAMRVLSLSSNISSYYVEKTLESIEKNIQTITFEDDDIVTTKYEIFRKNLRDSTTALLLKYGMSVSGFEDDLVYVSWVDEKSLVEINYELNKKYGTFLKRV